jgi:membrane-associated phospholipid phosphatase
MNDPLAVNANEAARNEAGLLDDAAMPLKPVKPRHVRFARHVSNILAPAPISLPLILLVSLYQASSVASAMVYAGTTLFFLSIGPFAYILIGVRMGKLSDVDVSKRTERLGPFIFGLISICIGWFVLVLIHAPAILITCLIITATSGLIMMFTTLWWKISIHASSLAGAATILTVLYGAIMLPAFGLLVLVSWSRVILRRHTVTQVVAGSLLSIALTAILLKIRGV